MGSWPHTPPSVPYQRHLNLCPGDVGHWRHRLHQRRGEEEVVGACGCQVQGHGDVKGQGEDWEVPLAEDWTQSTGEDGAGDGRGQGLITVITLLSTPSHQLWSLYHSLASLLGIVIPGSLETLVVHWPGSGNKMFNISQHLWKTKLKVLELPVWCSGHNWSTGLIPGQGISTCAAQKTP